MTREFNKKNLTILFSSAAAFIFSWDLCTGDTGGGGYQEISWILMAIGLLGGLGLFLYGMEKMSGGMKKAAGNQMRSILAVLTGNRIAALMVGASVTMVIQSSSATTVMLLGFVQAGLMSFSKSLGVILGADIGTTITAQLIAFKVTKYALLMVAVGFALRMFSRGGNTRNIGEVILGFGLLFLGMNLMSETMKPLRTYEDFISIMRGFENPLAGILLGTVFTALIQSSSAFIGIIIVLAQQELITIEAGIPMILGANIGTCVTAVLAGIGTSREARRVAIAHVLFKVIGVILFVFWIPGFSWLIRSISSSFNFDTAREIANAHTIFNVSLALLFLPFIKFFGDLVTRILPDKKVDEDLQLSIWYLDEKSLKTPFIAINLSRAEISRMAKLLWRMMRAIIIPFMSDERIIRKEAETKEERAWLLKEIPRRDEFFPQISLLEGIEMREKKIDFLDEKISDYLVQIARGELTNKQTAEVYGMMSIIKDMESIGDIIHKNMIPLIVKKRQLEMDFSNDGKEELMIYHEKVCSHLRLLTEAFAEADPRKAFKIMSEERKYLDLELQYRVRHLERLRYEKKESLATHEVHMELMDLMKQIVVYSSNIAKTFFEFSNNEE
ncbi:Na/Pi cotransporter family protein [Thermodesulfobacteriota bacterium]